MKIGRRLEIRKAKRFRLRPHAGISRMCWFSCGGFHLYWLWFAIECDHLSARWQRVKRGEA